MRLEDLNYFLAVAEAGHVGRASERLGQSQPALTKGIQRLELELGIQLFDRTPKGMALTSAGQAFFARARHVRANLDEAIQEANDLSLGKIGLIRVGVPPNYSETFFGEACAELLKQRPATRLQVTTGLNDRLIAALRLGDLDLSIGALSEHEADDLDQRRLFDDPLHVVAREGHPLFSARKLRLSDLTSAGWLLPGMQVSARKKIEARFEDAGLPPPTVVIETNSTIGSLANVLLGSDLIAITGELTLRRFGGLRALPMTDAQWPRTIGISTRKGAYLSPLVQRFIELLQYASSSA
ncbi:LysR family transcriptional regulator [Paraburkholderia sp. MPAMCS5]|uniref:LysR family transcriptional regulator n=1 Tax=Paraburkholderia sp. MPAMCS5 TaxID=3112563 RepID=UPI002E19AC60|nr:LysR family transcriptional regulator [Paraburkholderia sp. MPAMCS5]